MPKVQPKVSSPESPGRRTHVRRAALQEAFTIMDRDGSSQFNLDELATVMRAMGHGEGDINLNLSACRQQYGSSSLLNSEEFWAFLQRHAAQGANDSFEIDTQ